MTSPALAHKMRVLAARATANAVPGQVVDRHTSDAHRLIRAKLDEDRRRLKAIQSREAKIALKRELLPDYDDYANAVIGSGVGVQDEVLSYIMTWRIDVGDFDGAFVIAKYIIEHKLSTAERFKRTPGTFVAEETAIAALRAYARQETFPVATLEAAHELTETCDMPDQVRAKLLFATGRHLIEHDSSRAIALLRKAVDLHEAVGAKKDIEQLAARLRREGSNEPPSSDGT